MYKAILLTAMLIGAAAAIGAALPDPPAAPQGFLFSGEAIDGSGNLIVTYSPAPTSQPATQPTSQPAPPPDYTVNASEVLQVRSAATQPAVSTTQPTVSADPHYAVGDVVPQLWTLNVPGALHTAQDGFNGSWQIPANTTPGVYTLTVANLDGTNAAAKVVAVNPDPYTVYQLNGGDQLAAAIAAHPNYARFILPPGPTSMSAGITIAGNVQIVGQGMKSTQIILEPPTGSPQASDPRQTWPPMYAFYVPGGGSIAFTDLQFTSKTGANGSALNSSGKTACVPVYCGTTCAATRVLFSRVDTGLQMAGKARGLLAQDCLSNDGQLKGVTIWIGGTDTNVEGCALGTSAQEHALRASLGEANQVPTWVRVCDNAFFGIHPGQTPVNILKESDTYRDALYIVVRRCFHDGWTSFGQNNGTPADHFGHYLIDGNQSIDPSPSAMGVGTLMIRQGVDGPGIVTNNQTSSPIYNGAHVPPVMTGNTARGTLQVSHDAPAND